MWVVSLRMQGISLKYWKVNVPLACTVLLSTVDAKLLFVTTYVSHTKSLPRGDIEFSFHLICILKHCAHFTKFPGCTRHAVNIWIHMKSRGASPYFFSPPWCSAAADNTQHHGTLLSWFFSSAYKAAATAQVQWAIKKDQISVRPRAFCPVCIKYFSTQVVTAGLCSVVVLCVRCTF